MHPHAVVGPPTSEPELLETREDRCPTCRGMEVARAPPEPASALRRPASAGSCRACTSSWPARKPRAGPEPDHPPPCSQERIPLAVRRTRSDFRPPGARIAVLDLQCDVGRPHPKCPRSTGGRRPGVNGIHDDRVPFVNSARDSTPPCILQEAAQYLGEVTVIALAIPGEAGRHDRRPSTCPTPRCLPRGLLTPIRK